MKKISLFICWLICVFSISIPAQASAEYGSIEDMYAMPDLGIEAKEVSFEEANRIEELLYQMNDVVVQTNGLVDENMTISAAGILSQMQTLGNQYELLKAEAEELGCIFLTDEQALKYVYGDRLPEVTAQSSIEYPPISGITFSIVYYTYKGNNMAKCIATQTPNKVSKLVKNYDAVEMFGETSFSNYVSKKLQMTAYELADYALGNLTDGTISYLVSALFNLPGDLFPSSSSAPDAKLNLTVSTNSTVVHIWRYMNNDYYFRTSSVKATINETWVFRDVNGVHYTKTNSYTSYSRYYDDSDRAIAVNSNESYGIYHQYKAEGLLGLMYQKQEVSPYTAALPIHFAN